MLGGRLFFAGSRDAIFGRGGRAIGLRRSASFAIRILLVLMGWAEESLLRRRT